MLVGTCSPWPAQCRGYVKHFFQCTDCANHFTEMASETAARAVMSRRHAVLWAWRAHNEVAPLVIACRHIFCCSSHLTCLHGTSWSEHPGQAVCRHGPVLPARDELPQGHHAMQVNRRQESVEKTSGEGDPAFPKMQWPPSELCPLCRLPSINKKADVTWNEGEVYRCMALLIPLNPQLAAMMMSCQHHHSCHTAH